MPLVLKTTLSSEVPHTPSCKPKGCDPGGSIVSNMYHTSQPPVTIIDHKLQSYTAPSSEVQPNWYQNYTTQKEP